MIKMIGKRIAELRKARGWTQERLAEKMGLSNNYISNIENNCSIPSLESLMKICIALDVTPNGDIQGRKSIYGTGYCCSAGPMYSLGEGIIKVIFWGKRKRLVATRRFFYNKLKGTKDPFWGNSRGVLPVGKMAAANKIVGFLHPVAGVKGVYNN